MGIIDFIKILSKNLKNIQKTKNKKQKTKTFLFFAEKI